MPKSSISGYKKSQTSVHYPQAHIYLYTHRRLLAMSSKLGPSQVLPLTGDMPIVFWKERGYKIAQHSEMRVFTKGKKLGSGTESKQLFRVLWYMPFNLAKDAANKIECRVRKLLQQMVLQANRPTDSSSAPHESKTSSSQVTSSGLSTPSSLVMTYFAAPPLPVTPLSVCTPSVSKDTSPRG